MKKMNSISETFRLCKENQIGVSKKLLLQLAKTGEIPSIQSGRSILINWDRLMEYLDTSRITQEEKNPSGIRKISA